MMTIRHLALMSLLGLLVPCGCGGGGGGDGDGDFALSDIVGSWQGTTATVTVEGDFGLAAGTVGLVIDPDGTATGAGAIIVEGTVSLASAALGTYRFTGTGPNAGFDALMVLDPDRNHLLWATNSLGVGAWQRDASGFAGPYTDADLRDETWVGLACGLSPTTTATDPETLAVAIDAAGSFTAGTSATNVAPLTVADTIKGAYTGDAIDSGPPVETSNLVVLITPDRQFVAVFSCLTDGTFPEDCSYAALSR